MFVISNGMRRLICVVVCCLIAAPAVLAEEGYSSKKDDACEGDLRYCSVRRLVSDKATLVLKQVVIVHRHGDRAPLSMKVGSFEQTSELIDFWKSRMPPKRVLEMWGRLNTERTGTYLLPKGPGSSTTYPFGHLTELGADQLRTLGATLRERYMGSFGFIPRDLDPTQNITSIVQVRSSRYPRTIQSVQNLLMGLYPEHTRLPDSNGRPATIDIATFEREQEILTGGDVELCPFLGKLKKDFDSKLEIPARFLDAQDTVKKVLFPESEAAEVIPAPVSWVRVSEVGICHQWHGLPSLGFSETVLDTITSYNGWLNTHRNQNVSISRLTIGRLVSNILNSMETVMLDDPTAPKMRIFSGHDATVLPFMAALHAHDESWPPYASYLALELLWDEKELRHVVRLRYNHQDVGMYGSTDASGMLFETFRSKLSELVPENYEAACSGCSDDDSSAGTCPGAVLSSIA